MMGLVLTSFTLQKMYRSWNTYIYGTLAIQQCKKTHSRENKNFQNKSHKNFLANTLHSRQDSEGNV